MNLLSLGLNPITGDEVGVKTGNVNPQLGQVEPGTGLKGRCRFAAVPGM